jgi:hypothetical protein
VAGEARAGGGGDAVNPRENSQIAMFIATLSTETLDEALANLELDAKSCGWSRASVRRAAGEIRSRYRRPLRREVMP